LNEVLIRSDLKGTTPLDAKVKTGVGYPSSLPFMNRISEASLLVKYGHFVPFAAHSLVLLSQKVDLDS